VQDQLALELAFVLFAGHGHEVKDIRVLEGLLGKIRARRRHRGREVGDGLARAFVESGLDLVDQDIAGPAIVDGGSRVPETCFGVVELLDQREVVVPGQLCKRRLHNCRGWPGFGEGPHVLQVSRRESGRFGKLPLQIGREPVDDPGSPAFKALAAQNVLPDRQIAGQHLLVRGSNRLGAASVDLARDGGKQLGIPIRHAGFRRR
jgi:hypothetical protein